MSYSFSIYARARDLPTTAELAERLRRLAPPVTFDESRELTSLNGYFPVYLGNQEAGFEVLVSPITEGKRERYRRAIENEPEADDGYLDALESGDVKFLFVCHDEASVAACSLFASALARAAHAYFCDPQRNVFKKLDVSDDP